MTSRNAPFFLLFLLAASQVLTSGCHRETAKGCSLSGTITVAGEPLDHGLISFTPIDNTPGPKATASINKGLIR